MFAFHTLAGDCKLLMTKLALSKVFTCAYWNVCCRQQHGARESRLHLVVGAIRGAVEQAAVDGFGHPIAASVLNKTLV